MARTRLFTAAPGDLSVNGASVYSEHDIFVEERVRMLLAVPSFASNKPPKIIEISARMIYAVLSSDHQRFRTDLHFLRFKDDERRVLEEGLAKRFPEDF